MTSDEAFNAWYKVERCNIKEGDTSYREAFEAGYIAGLEAGQASRAKAAELWCVRGVFNGKECRHTFATLDEARQYADYFEATNGTVLSLETTEGK